MFLRVCGVNKWVSGLTVELVGVWIKGTWICLGTVGVVTSPSVFCPCLDTVGTSYVLLPGWNNLSVPVFRLIPIKYSFCSLCLRVHFAYSTSYTWISTTVNMIIIFDNRSPAGASPAHGCTLQQIQRCDLQYARSLFTIFDRERPILSFDQFFEFFK